MTDNANSTGPLKPSQSNDNNNAPQNAADTVGEPSPNGRRIEHVDYAVVWADCGDPFSMRSDELREGGREKWTNENTHLSSWTWKHFTGQARSTGRDRGK